ncbi:dihydroflavonal-4-reductase [Penicillium angulare]|uniref:Dihydroflavonal-4-reductase n=1 Tax=Penicillium angulare TaxID=116970 RepID=A0A9W9KPN8_9EURO|nr:dihydroflavonal-4-reductase [Penicillium angulare]
MNKSLLFITGATGFIASEVIPAALQAGYRVRLSIRKAEQETVLRGRYPEFTSDIETVVIPDLSNANHIGQNLNGVDHIIHIASPMPGHGVDFRADYVNPSVEGTLSILNAAVPFKQIKKVIIMSSGLALAPITALASRGADVRENTGEIFPVDLSMDLPKVPSAHGIMYAGAKILAHQATRDFIETQAPHYSVISFHPGFVLGRSRLQQTAEDVTGMNSFLWTSLNKKSPVLGNVWVHVRDVADAHIRVLETDLDSGTEILLSHPPISWQEVVDYSKEKYPDFECKLQPPFGECWTADTITADKVLGIKWRSHHMILDEVIGQQLAFQEKKSVA